MRPGTVRAFCCLYESGMSLNVLACNLKRVMKIIGTSGSFIPCFVPWPPAPFPECSGLKFAHFTHKRPDDSRTDYPFGQ
jgi:hypothetical protein